MPLAPGDLMFVGWDSDANDIAFVTTTDVAAGEVIYFTDSEWNGTQFDQSEQFMEWTVPAGGVPAGTVVTIDMDRGTSTASIDAGGTLDYMRGAYSISTSNEQFWAFQGTRTGNTAAPTNFIAVIANEADGNYRQTPDLTNTGLTTSNGAIIIDGDEDYMEFTADGTLGTPVSRDDLIAAISDLSNWTTADGGGNNNPNPGGGFDVNLPPVVCFTAGTRILTPGGRMPVERLVPGDLVTTMDHGPAPVRWVGRRTVPAEGRFAPVRIAPGVLGNETVLRVSPQHRMLVQGWRAELYCGEDAVLVPAVSLVNGDTIRRDPGGLVTYVHILLDGHQIVWAEGAASETLFPGDMALSALEGAAREEIVALFPELAGGPPGRFAATARPVRSGREAWLLAA